MSHPPPNFAIDRLSTLLKNLPGMAYRCLNSPGWPMEFVSDGCFDLCGYHRLEIESQTVLWGDFTHPDMIADVDQEVRTAASAGEPFEVEYRIITRDGQEKWVWERGRVVDVSDDGVAILEGFITDITDRKQAETALLRAEAYAQAVVETAVESIITVDDRSQINTINRTAQNMFGYRQNDAGFRPFRVLVHPDDYEVLDDYFESCKNRCPLHKNGIELSGIRKDGNTFPIHLSISEVPDEASQRFVVLIRDLSKRHAVEREIREQRELLAHVDRLNTLGEMAMGIAHEINQPLTAISMYAQSSIGFANTHPPNFVRLNNALEKLSAQAQRAGAVIERMQKMAKQGESYQRPTDCVMLIKEVYKLAELEARQRNFIIALHLDHSLPPVHSDPVQIQQVLLNLLRNGMEAMQEANCHAGSKIILQAQATNTHVTITVTDMGGGISADLAKTLYQPFTSTKSTGMGLGLSISRSIVQAHGGKLEFANHAHKGASFFFELPQIQSQHE